MGAFLGPDSLAAWIQAHRQGLPASLSPELLGRLVEVAYAVSLTTEEGRPPRFGLFVPFDGRTLPLDVRFPLVLDVEALDRTWVVADPKTHVLVVEVRDQRLQLAGLARRASMPRRFGASSRDAELEGLHVGVRGPGNLAASIGVERAVLARGQLLTPLWHVESTFVRGWSKELATAAEDDLRELLGPGESVRLTRLELQQAFEGLVVRSIARVEELGHGGTLLVVPGREAPHVAIKHVTVSDALRTATLDWLHAISAEREILDQPGASPNDVARLVRETFRARATAESAWDALAALTNTDGAVVVSRNLTILGFGGIIAPTALAAQITEVDRFRQNHRALEARDLGGTRHQSAARHAAPVPGAAALVVSQDGRITAMENRGPGHVWINRPLVALPPATER